MEEMHQILKFTILENSKRTFCVCSTYFSLLGVKFTLLNFVSISNNLKIYSDKPDISFKFNSNQKIISKRENLKTKELYVRQISNRVRINWHLKNGNIQLSKNKSLISEFKSHIFKVTYFTKSYIFRDYEIKHIAQ